MISLNSLGDIRASGLEPGDERQFYKKYFSKSMVRLPISNSYTLSMCKAQLDRMVKAIGTVRNCHEVTQLISHKTLTITQRLIFSPFGIFTGFHLQPPIIILKSEKSPFQIHYTYDQTRGKNPVKTNHVKCKENMSKTFQRQGPASDMKERKKRREC